MPDIPLKDRSYLRTEGRGNSDRHIIGRERKDSERGWPSSMEIVPNSGVRYTQALYMNLVGPFLGLLTHPCPPQLSNPWDKVGRGEGVGSTRRSNLQTLSLINWHRPSGAWHQSHVSATHPSPKFLAQMGKLRSIEKDRLQEPPLSSH